MKMGVIKKIKDIFNRNTNHKPTGKHEEHTFNNIVQQLNRINSQPDYYSLNSDAGYPISLPPETIVLAHKVRDEYMGDPPIRQVIRISLENEYERNKEKQTNIKESS